jgi:hypothetical protein
MTHGDAIIDGNGIELGGKTAHIFYDFLYLLPDLVEVHMSRYELGKGVRDPDDGFPQLGFFHACSSPKTPSSRHLSAFSGSCAS